MAPVSTPASVEVPPTATQESEAKSSPGDVLKEDVYPDKTKGDLKAEESTSVKRGGIVLALKRSNPPIVNSPKCNIIDCYAFKFK